MNIEDMKWNSYYTRLSAKETSESIKELVELQKQQIQLLKGMLAEEKNNLRKLREKDDEYDKSFSSRHTSSFEYDPDDWSCFSVI